MKFWKFGKYWSLKRFGEKREILDFQELREQQELQDFLGNRKKQQIQDIRKTNKNAGDIQIIYFKSDINAI